MKWSRILLTSASILAFTNLTALAASTRHGYLSFSVHSPQFGFGFGYRYRPFYYRPTVRLGSPYPYYHRPVYARAYTLPTFAPYQAYSYGSGAIRTLVKPKRAEVYVDGYYAGIVDDFDGAFQKLYLAPGEHVIELRLEGHRDFQQRILVTPGHTQKVHHEMVLLRPGQPGQTEEEAEKPVEPVGEVRQESPVAHDRRAPPPPTSTAPAPPTSPVPGSASRARFGVLKLRVQPAEGQVRIDGEVWGHLGGTDELSIHLPAGRHWIELLRDGQPDFSTEVEIQLGQPTPLNVRLAP